MRPSFLALALILAGCSLIGLEHNDPPPVVPQGEAEGILIVDLDAPAAGPAVSVEESIREHIGGDALVVRGALFIDDADGTAWLCDSIITAQPAPQPSCGRPALLLRHPDAGGRQVSDVLAELIEASQVDELHDVETMCWAEDVTFYGRIINPAAEPS